MTLPAPSSPAGEGSPPPGGRGFLVGRVFGIPVYFSASWLLVAAFITVAYAPEIQDSVPGIGRAAYAVSAGFAVLLALSVLLHELGHCVMSQALGLPVKRVTVFLLGGVSEIKKEPQTAAREYLVAMAGPLVSVVLAAVSTGALLATDADTVAGALTGRLAFANGVIAVFNLLPGLPLDGGRVLRAALWGVTGDQHRATRAAAYGGRGLAVIVVPLLFVGLPLLLGGIDPVGLLFGALLGTFIWVGATQALRAGQLSERLPSVSVRALVRRALPVTADVPLAEALRRVRESDAYGLVIVDSLGRPDALVSEAAVVAVPEARRPWVNVGALARRLDPALVLRHDLRGRAVLDALSAQPASEYLVVDDAGSMVGMLSSADVARQIDPRAAVAR